MILIAFKLYYKRQLAYVVSEKLKDYPNRPE